MKIRLQLPLGVIPALMAFFSVQATLAQPTPGIVALGLHGQPNFYAKTDLAVFGGQTVAIDLAIPSKLRGDSVRVDLLQFAGDVAVRLKSNVPLSQFLGDDESLGDTLTIELPAVERVTHMVIRLMAAPSSKDRKPAGFIHLAVYPNTPLKERAKPLADALRQYQTGHPADLPPIVLIGDTEDVAPLRAFLTACDIPFLESNGILDTDRPMAGVLHFGVMPGSAKPETFPAFSQGHWLFFAKALRDRRLPGVYSTTTPNGVFTKVTLPLPAQLAHDPRAQENVLNLITEAASPVLTINVSNN